MINKAMAKKLRRAERASGWPGLPVLAPRRRTVRAGLGER